MRYFVRRVALSPGENIVGGDVEEKDRTGGRGGSKSA